MLRYLIDKLLKETGPNKEKTLLFEEFGKVPDDLVALGTPAWYLAHGDFEAVWWYNLLTKKLEYSETATDHSDQKEFPGAPYTDKGWIRGRVFKPTDRHYIVVYVNTGKNLPWLNEPVNMNLLFRAMIDLHNQIEERFGHIISDVVDQESHSLLERRNKII